MTHSRSLLITLVSCCTFALAGCQTDEEKAQGYYEAGLALLEEGDKERAALELRNVFNHDGFHKEARILYAQTMLDLDRPQEAYSQYRRLIEQYPDTVDARIALAEMAMEISDWDEVERHGTAVLELAPDMLRAQAVDLAMQYREATLDKDDAKRLALVNTAEGLLSEIRMDDTADNKALVRMIVDHYLRTEQAEPALKAVTATLERSPMTEDLHMLRAQLLAKTGDTDGTEAQLLRMIDLFPENAEFKAFLAEWYIKQEELDKAEAFLRSEAGDDTAPVDGHMAVVQLLQSTQGTDAAQAELTRLKDANAGTENGQYYAGILASVNFQTGDRAAAIRDMQAIVDAAPSGEKKVGLQVSLAQMLRETGQNEQAAALVDTILEADASNVPALQMRAARLIAEDKSGEAIVSLRAALDQNPRNSETLTLMAQAHERDGDINLMGERLSLAVEVSGGAAPETVRYARFLINQGRTQVARTILEEARSQTRNNAQLIQMLANLYLQAGDWQQAQDVAQDLRDLGTPQSQQAAVQLQALILQGQNRTEESLALLQEQFDGQENPSAAQKVRAVGLIIQTNIRNNQPDKARTALDAALADLPGNPDLRMLSATLYSLAGDTDKAEVLYRDLIEEFPTVETPVRLLVKVLIDTNQRDKARTVLLAALKDIPDSANLLWMQANFLEADRNFDGAIAIYDKLYEINSNNPVIANNLASMITTYRDDPESLARAANIVRRLRGTDVPAFQDTYGWIAYRRDNFEEALEYLEPAAAGLPDDALVHYHLGMTYLALNRTAEAKQTLQEALDLAKDSPLPQFDKARETLAGLE